MDRFETIRNKAQRDYEAQIQKEELENAKHKTLLNKVKELKPRIKYLIDLANECVNNHINIGQNYIGSFLDYYNKKDYFLTDGWAHSTGFWYDYNLKTITAIGKEGGGACLYNIKIYDEGKPLIQGLEGFDALERFLEDFDSFEERFLNYIDSLAQ